MRDLRLRPRHDAVLCQHGDNLHTGPDLAGQVRDDVLGHAFLPCPQTLSLPFLLPVLQRRRRVYVLLGRPAEQRVRGEITHEHRDNVVPQPRVASRVRVLEIEGAVQEGGEWDVMVFRRLVRAD